MTTHTHPPRAIRALALASLLAACTAAHAAAQAKDGRSVACKQGNGACPAPMVAPSAGTRVARRDGVVQISAGSEHTCAIDGDGQAFCWGSATYDRLGTDPRSTADQPVPVPVAMPAGVRFTAISAGSDHTCALAAGGDAYCWGANNSGELGVLSSRLRLLPSQVHAPPGVRFTAVSAGYLYSCALAVNRKAYCWGSDRNGALGNGSRGDEAVPYEVTTPAGVTFTRIVAGLMSTCALGSNGRAYCWGADYGAGLLGDGPGTHSGPGPVEVHLPPGRVTDVAIGGSHACAVMDDGGAYCWGSDESGALGNGPRGELIQPAPVAVALPPGVALVSLALGGAHSCGLDGQGRVFCWGSDGYGQLGDGDPRTSEPAPIEVFAPRGIRFTQIESGWSHTCAVASDGRAYCWGSDADGRLGDGGTSRNSSIPVPVAGF